jgi:hypothetical protein
MQSSPSLLLSSISPTTLRHSYDDERSSSSSEDITSGTHEDDDNSTAHGRGEYSSTLSSSSKLRTLRILDKMGREQHNLEEYKLILESSILLQDLLQCTKLVVFANNSNN